ncbi:hypothetical protein FACS1894140_3320 [Spirochaetia bacterium]|nr:hypothetical protein FACS1894140_3320 [Spirochaetia bacterium]
MVLYGMIKKARNLKTKLLLLYFSFIGILLVFIYFFSTKIYSDDTAHIENILFDYASSQISAKISDRIRNYKNIIAEIAMSKDMITLFQYSEKGREGSPPDSMVGSASSDAIIRNRLIEAFSNFLRTDNYIASAALVSRSSEMLLYQRFGGFDFLLAKQESEDFRHAFLKFGGEEYLYDVNIIEAVTLPGAPEETKRYMYFTYPAVEPITKELYGVLVLEVETTVFSAAIDLKREIASINFSLYSSITNADGVVVFSSLIENVGEKISVIIPDNVSARSQLIENTSLYLNLFFERGFLQKFIDKFRNILIGFILVIITVFSIIVSMVIDRLIIQSGKIAQAIGQFRKTRQVSTLEIDPNDEVLFAIADQFNMMSGEIEKLLQELMDKNERIHQAKDHQRHAEIQALQAQINPHFIYNALDRINWIAIDNNQDEISHMLSELGSLLRYSISNIDSLVPLDAELEWMKKYVFIQGERYGKKIDLLMNIDSNAGGFPIYKMLLQPLVENSIHHGFHPDIESPEIRISSRILKDGRLEIILSDNGHGMDEAALNMIRRICSRENIDDTDNVGINNVVNRLWHYYGEFAELTVKSHAGEGTVFILIIPHLKQGG